MVDIHRTESALTRRPLKDRVIGQARQLAGIVEKLPGDGDQLEPDVSSSLETIQRVTETYAILLDKLSSYELKVRELTQALGAATRAKDEALQAAGRAEREVGAERERAAAAEAQAERSDETVRELERQLASLQAQTTKLMAAVEQLFPDVENADEAQRRLRVIRS